MVGVTDASVWIDLHNADLLDAAFDLNVTWVTPDIMVRDEILTVDRTVLADRDLEERTLSGTELNEVVVNVSSKRQSVAHSGSCESFTS